MIQMNTRLPFLAALALGALTAAGCSHPPPPPPPPPPQPPPAVVVPTKLELDLLGAQLNIKTDVEFAVDKAEIRNNRPSELTLGTVTAILKRTPQISRLRIEGHTDSDGNAAHNLELSLDRANSVKAWIVQHGVDPSRLVTVGCGSKDPLVPNDSPEHKQKNRRTEFDIELINGAPPANYTEPCAPNKFER